MAFLSKEELEALKKNPELAAVAEKLEKGQFIPKDRFDEVRVAGQEALEKVKKFEEERTAEADKIKKEQERIEAERLSKAGAWEKLIEKEKQVAAENLKKYEVAQKAHDSEKEVADRYREHLKAKVEKIKGLLGDKWLPEYENFSIDSLEKIAVQHGHTTVDTSSNLPNPKPEPKKSYDEMSPEEFAKQQDLAKQGKLVKQGG